MISLTESAATEIVRQAEKLGRPAGLRIAIRGGGCKGFSYVFEWGTEASADHVIEQGDAKLYVDPKSFVYLDGSTITFEKTLMQSGFKIDNPKEKSSCGCGESVEL
jgi:iron-sulfur cluster assembly protein